MAKDQRKDICLTGGSDCLNCPLDGRLLCRADPESLLGFAAIALPFMVSAALTLLSTVMITGRWWPQIAYLAFLVLFFVALEARLLCRQCPQYAREGRSGHPVAQPREEADEYEGQEGPRQAHLRLLRSSQTGPPTRN